MVGLFFPLGFLGQVLVRPIPPSSDSINFNRFVDTLRPSESTRIVLSLDSLPLKKLVVASEPQIVEQIDSSFLDRMKNLPDARVNNSLVRLSHQDTLDHGSTPKLVTKRVMKKIDLYRNSLPTADTSYLEVLFNRDGLTDIRSIDSTIVIYLQYADTANFLHMNVYDGLQRGYLTCETAWRLAAAQYYLNLYHPGHHLVVLDATRPLHIQQMMWDSLNMSDHRKHFYLASPDSRSLHNYGRAVDVTIADSNGTLLDMGTDFDAFTLVSAPEYESEYLEKGRLNQLQIKNRQILRRVMRLAGFKPIKSEWWHFNLGTIQEAKKNHSVVR